MVCLSEQPRLKVCNIFGQARRRYNRQPLLIVKPSLRTQAEIFFDIAGMEQPDKNSYDRVGDLSGGERPQENDACSRHISERVSV